MVVTFARTTALRELITAKVKENVERGITNQMNDAVTSRAAIIEDYVTGAEHTMVEFSLSPEVINLLKNPDDTASFEAAQEYTEKFAAVEGFSRVYISQRPKQRFLHIPTKA